MRLEMRTLHSFPRTEPHKRLRRATGAPAGRGPHDAVSASWGGAAERGDGAPRAEAWGVRGGEAPRIWSDTGHTDDPHGARLLRVRVQSRAPAPAAQRCASGDLAG